MGSTRRDYITKKEAKRLFHIANGKVGRGSTAASDLAFDLLLRKSTQRKPQIPEALFTTIQGTKVVTCPNGCITRLWVSGYSPNGEDIKKTIESVRDEEG